MVPASFQLRLIAPVICCAFWHTVHSQLAEWADQRSEEIRIDRVLPVGGGRWAVIGKTVFGGSNMISVRNSTGSIEWEVVDQFFVDNGWGDVILLADSGLLHVGAVDGCDYTSPPSRVRRYSPEGTVLWERMFDSEFSQTPTIAANGPTDLLAVAGPDSMYILDLDGNITDGWPLQFPGPYALHWQEDSALYMVSGLILSRVDLDGSELNATGIGNFFQDLHYDGQQVFVLANDSIRRFSPTLEVLGVTPLPSSDYNSAFIVSEDTLFVNTSAGLHTVNEEGNIGSQFPWPELPELTTTGCAVRGGQVFSVGTTSISGRRTGISRLLSMTGEAAQHDEDIEVILQVDSSWAEFMGNMWSRKADITGHVVNHGTTPLNDVVVHMWTEVPYIMCSLPGHRVVGSELGLQPGDTASFPFGIVDVAIWQTASQAAGVDDICVVALAPNNLADRHTEDNTSCVSVEFVLGGDEVDDEPSIMLAPNPATGTLVLSGSTLIGRMVHVRLLDTMGRIVLDRNVVGSTGGLTIDVSELPSAAYVVTTDAEGLHAMARLIIVHP